MRSATVLRQRWLQELPRVMARPGRWARDGREMQTVASTLLRELCFVDERDGDYDEVCTVLAGFGKLGVHAPVRGAVRRRAQLRCGGRLGVRRTVSPAGLPDGAPVARHHRVDRCAYRPAGAVRRP